MAETDWGRASMLVRIYHTLTSARKGRRNRMMMFVKVTRCWDASFNWARDGALALISLNVSESSHFLVGKSFVSESEEGKSQGCINDVRVLDFAARRDSTGGEPPSEMVPTEPLRECDRVIIGCVGVSERRAIYERCCFVCGRSGVK